MAKFTFNANPSPVTSTATTKPLKLTNGPVTKPYRPAGTGPDQGPGGIAGPKKPKLGSGERFSALASSLKAKGAENPNALSAWIGREKYGNERFQKLALKGR